MLAITLVAVVGIITTGVVYGDQATPHYTGDWDSNSNSVSSTGGAMNADTYSDGLWSDTGEGVLNLGDNGQSCTADAGKVTVANKRLEIGGNYSGDQLLKEDGFGANSYTDIGVIVYGGDNSACNYMFYVYQQKHSPHDASIADISGVTSGSYTGTFYAGPIVRADSWGAFGNSSADVDATANSVKILEYTP